MHGIRSDTREDGCVHTARRLTPGLLRVAAVVATAYALHALVPALPPLALSVGLGMLTAAVGWWPESAQPGSGFAAKRLLRVGIVVLGFSLSLAQVLDLGAAGMAVVVVVVAATFASILVVGRLVGVSRDLALLVAAGYSICGVSAIAATEPATDADREEVAYAVALVTLCGTLSIVVLPLLGSALGLAAETFGAWTGAAVHDVGQVVATASVGGAVALQAAVVVKLSRVVLLAPLVIGLNLARRRSTRLAADAGADARAGVRQVPLLPLFVAGFIAAVAVRSTGLVPDPVLAALAVADDLLLAAALAALGSGVRWAALRQLGGRPLVLGLVAWVVVAGLALLGVQVAQL
jgi:uncharacterized integral membrane protein (TIGR00698 family)